MRPFSFHNIIFYSCLILIAGCGGGGGGSAPAPVVTHAPGISNLQFSPITTTKGAGGGAISVTGSFDFTDNGGDLTSFTLTSYYSNGQVASGATLPISGTGGAKVGRVALYLNVATTVADLFKFEAYATDAAGSKSNVLSGTFLITDISPAIDAPNISNFQFTPSSVIQGSGGGSVSVVGSFDFTDTAGNLATVTYTFYNTVGIITGTNTGPISGIAGITSGWVKTTFTASTNTVGDLRMDVYTTDSKGSNSNTLSQTFKIMAATPIAPPTEREHITNIKSEPTHPFMTLQGARLITGTPQALGDTIEIQPNSSKSNEQ